MKRVGKNQSTPKKFRKQENSVTKVPNQGTPHHVQSHDSGTFSQGSDYIEPNQEAFAQAETERAAGAAGQDVEMASGAGGRGGSGGAAEPGGTGVNRILIGGNNGVDKSGHTFNRRIEVNTVNYANKYIPTVTMPEQHRIGSTYALLTSLAVINPNNLQYYMNEEEWLELPSTTWAKKCRITCTPLSYRTSFETASTAVGVANSQMPVNIEYAVGINKDIVHGMAPLVTTGMVPTNTQALSESDDNILWNPFINGVRTNQSPALRSYAYFPSNSNVVCSVDLSKYVTKENLITAKGHSVVEYEYNFKVSPLKSIRSPYGMYNGTYNKFPLMQQNEPLFMGDGTSIPDPQGWSSTNSASNVNFKFTNGIEKAQFMTMEAENTHVSDAMPMIYIGGQAVLASMPTVADPKFSDVYIQWAVDFTLEVEWNINYADLQLKLLPHFNPMYARLLQNKLNTMHVWDSAGHQLAFVGERFYNCNTTVTKLVPQPATATNETNKDTNKIKRVKRTLLPDFQLICNEDMPPETEDQVPKRPNKAKDYKGVLKENEGVFELYDI